MAPARRIQEAEQMSQTKNKSAKLTKKATPRQAPAPDPKPAGIEEVLTSAEAAAYLRVPEQELLNLIDSAELPGRKIGSEWRFLKSALQDWLRTGPQRPNLEAWLSMAGAWKDDPDLEAIVEEAYRRRGRPITEDGSYKNFS
jgi:excisionase family DNA binding protein